MALSFANRTLEQALVEGIIFPVMPSYIERLSASADRWAIEEFFSAQELILRSRVQSGEWPFELVLQIMSLMHLDKEWAKHNRGEWEYHRRPAYLKEVREIVRRSSLTPEVLDQIIIACMLAMAPFYFLAESSARQQYLRTLYTRIARGDLSAADLGRWYDELVPTLPR